MKVRKLIITIMLMAILLTMPIPSTAQSGGVTRDEILWSSGFWGPPGVNNPAHYLSASWETRFMYDVLFDWNSVLDDPLVPFLGETIQWNGDGSVLTITMKSVGKWSDNTTINADDVVYSFNEIYAAENGPLNSTFTKRIESLEKTGEYEISVTVKTGFEFSKTVFFMFIGRWQILPSHIWPQIIDYEGVVGNSKYQMAVDWLEPSFPNNLKVASGMYIPYSKAVDRSWTLYERRDDWWGLGVLSDTLPAPKYIGMKSYDTNFAANSEFVSGEIDWFGGYIQDIGLEIEKDPNIGTYYGDQKPYFASLSSIVEILPNHLVYPLSELWFRKVVAYSLNIKDMIDVGASGYLDKARVGRIDDRSPQLAEYYNQTVEDVYGFDYNVSQALSILQENAIKVDGTWYTKDTPTEWQSKYTDALPGEAGFNVKIGPYDIMTVSGWSDFERHVESFKDDMENIGIPITVKKDSYSVFTGKLHSMDYQFLLYGEGPGLLDSALSNFAYFVGPAGQSVNTTGWYSPEMVNLLEQFEVQEQGSPEDFRLANLMETEIAKDLPSIPLFGNGYWYSYRTDYWVNWPTLDKNEMPPIAMWAFDNTGLMNQLVWSLQANVNAPADDSPGFGIWILAIPVILVIPIIWGRIRRR